MKIKNHARGKEGDGSASVEAKVENQVATKQEVKEEQDHEDKKVSLKRKADEPLQSPGQKVLLLSCNNEMWWNENEEENEEDETKFEYLEHHGPFFPPYFESSKAKIKYKGETIELDAIQEELAWYWCQTIGTDWEKKETYRTNFETQFIKKFKGNDKIKMLNDFDFSSMVKKRDDLKEKRSNRTPEEKKIEKDQKLERDAKYGFCIVDGVREKVGNYSIEPPTLFKGRGDHPKAGFLKGRIKPEDITINCSEKAPVPKCSIPGHNWKEFDKRIIVKSMPVKVVHNDKVTWLASYSDYSVKASYKYVFLGASSKFKGLNDRKKYEKARRLKSLINKIREDYEQKLKDKDVEKRQLGTATYLIDKFALRVGNEKSEDEADTVGCCSLRVEHITIEANNHITLDFLGKDSMRYHNTVQVTEVVWKNIQSFHKGKSPDDNLFDRINATTLNDYLRGLMPGLTAKVFRTYNASSTLQQELGRQNVEDSSLEEKIQYYNEANKQVAILCNHQKTVSKNFDLQREKMKEKISLWETYHKELKAHLEKVKKKPLDKDRTDEIEYGKFENLEAKPEPKKNQKEEKTKIFKKKFPATKEKTEEQLKNCEKNLRKEKILLEDKEQNKEIALGTSKINYNDPRITVAWCKRNECPIEKVFAKALREKFPWAMSIDPDYEF